MIGTLDVTRDDGLRAEVGFGCAHLMRVSGRRNRWLLLEEAFSQGIRHFDVARSYGLGATEADVGRFVRDKRDKIVIATKFGLPMPQLAQLARFAQRPLRAAMSRLPRARAVALRSPGTHASQFRFEPNEARASLETSMLRLGVDYVDIYFLHDPVKGAYEIGAVRALMDDLVARGHIRRWGVAGEPDPTQAVRADFEDLNLVVQTRSDVLDAPVQPLTRDADITYGVLTSALPVILAHVRSSPAVRRRWHEETGVDCGEAEHLAVLLLEESMRAREGRVVLMSTTRRDRVGVARLACERVANRSGEGCASLRRLIASEFGRRA